MTDADNLPPELEEALALRALDAGDAASDAVAARAVDADPALAGDLGRLTEAAAALGETVAKPPPVALRSRVLDAALAERAKAPDAPPLEGPSRAARVVAFAAAALLLVAVGIGVGVAIDGAGEPSPAQAERTYTAAMRALNRPGAHYASLQPMGDVDMGDAGLGVVVDREGDAWLVGAGIPEPADGRTHQLWVVREQAAPEPAGTFDGGVVWSELPMQVTSGAIVAVTDEPEGGSLAPTTPIVAAATF